MRNAFAKQMLALSAEDDRLVLLSGDIGNRMFDSFKEQNGERFFNCGVAEANMVGMAAGMALNGLRPVTYTIAPFMTTRCLEQIRVDVCYHDVPVIIVSVGGGLSYAALGPTHHACEDISLLRSLPNMTVLCPCDAMEVHALMPAALALGKPVYLRLGKKGEPLVHDHVPKLEIGKGYTLREGADLCILAAGTILPEALQAAESLKAKLVSFHTVKPLDEALLSEVFDRFSHVVTVEEHSLVGGLGSAVAEWRADYPQGQGRLLRLGTPDRFFKQAGSQAYARRELGLDGASLTDRIEKTLKG